MRIDLIFPLLLATVTLAQGATASWYGEKHRGKLTTSGEPFNPDARTCATWFYPFGTMLEVRTGNGRKTVVRVNDRGPARRLVRQGRVIDLSRRAFQDLADLRRGVVPVRIGVRKNSP